MSPILLHDVTICVYTVLILFQQGLFQVSLQNISRELYHYTNLLHSPIDGSYVT